jgi:hypothetical protein
MHRFRTALLVPIVLAALIVTPVRADEITDWNQTLFRAAVVVATVAKPTASLWTAPLLDRLIEERDMEPYEFPTERALAPRFGGPSLFYLSLSARGTGDGLWRSQDGQAFEVRKGADDVLSEPAAVSPDGSHVAVVVRQQGKRRLAIMSADGTNSRTLAASIDVQGAAGPGSPASKGSPASESRKWRASSG